MNQVPAKRSWRRAQGLAGVMAVLVGFHGFTAARAHWDFGINETVSLPNWAFITDKTDKNVGPGDLVTFVSPPTPFYPAGKVFVKRVLGVEGDHVRRDGQTFYVNDRRVGDAKPRNGEGVALTAGPVGTIPKGRIFVAGDHPDSLDSRYAMIGWISTSRIVGKARPVL